jgi:hypothetical protein
MIGMRISRVEVDITR